MTRNQLQYWQNREVERANLARERETNRANRRQEELKSAELNEMYRANKAREAENVRSHQTSETETARANAAQERLTATRDTNSYLLGQTNARIEQTKANTAARNVANQYTLGLANLGEAKAKRLQDMEMGTRNIAANLAGSLLNAGVRLLTGGKSK